MGHSAALVGSRSGGRGPPVPHPRLPAPRSKGASTASAECCHGTARETVPGRSAISPGTCRPGSSGTRGSRPTARRSRRSRASRPGGPSPTSRRRPRRGSSGVSSSSTSSTCSRVNLPCLTHCQICEREISAVAASSIMLLIPAAPRPPSQNEMYWKPTETSLRRPSSVMSPGVEPASSSCSAVTSTSSRCLSIWFGLVAEHGVERLQWPRRRRPGARPRCRRSRPRPRASCPP